MSQPDQHPVDRFIELRTQVLQTLRDAQRKTEQEIRSFQTVLYIHYVIVVLTVFALGFVVLPSAVNDLLVNIVQRAPSAFLNRLLSGARWGPVLLVLAIWTVVVVSPSVLVQSWSKRRPALMLPYTLVVCPEFLALGYILLEYLRRGSVPLMTIVQLAALAVLISLLVLGTLFGVLRALSAAIPQIVFLLQTSTVAGRATGSFPSYEELLKCAAKCTKDMIGQYSLTELEQIDVIAQRKLTGINGRLQSLSMAVGSLALLSLLTAVLAANQIAQTLDVLLSWFAYVSGTEHNITASGLSGTRVFAGLLLIVVLLALRYFAIIYRELRVLEIISMLCGIEVVSRARSSPTPPAPLQPRNERMSLSRPVIEVASLVFRMVRRLVGSGQP